MVSTSFWVRYAYTNSLRRQRMKLLVPILEFRFSFSFENRAHFCHSIETYSKVKKKKCEEGKIKRKAKKHILPCAKEVKWKRQDKKYEERKMRIIENWIRFTYKKREWKRNKHCNSFIDNQAVTKKKTSRHKVNIKRNVEQKCYEWKKKGYKYPKWWNFATRLCANRKYFPCAALLQVLAQFSFAQITLQITNE